MTASPKPRVLHVDNREAFLQSMDRTYQWKYETLDRQHGIRCVDVRTEIKETEAREFDILLVGICGLPLHPRYPPEGRLPTAVLKIIPKRCVVFEDMREWTFDGGIDVVCEQINRLYHYVIATYECAELDRIRRSCPAIRKFFVLPHYINTQVYRDYGQPKIRDVVLFGNTKVHKYPFRNRLGRLLLNSNLNVEVVAHPGYEQFDTNKCGEGLALKINESRLAVATPSMSDYLVSKYYEISACRTVVTGTMPASGEAVWGDNYVALRTDMSDREILDRLSAALADPEGLRRMADTMYEKIHRDYSLDAFVPAVNEILREIHADTGPEGFRYDVTRELTDGRVDKKRHHRPSQ